MASLLATKHPPHQYDECSCGSIKAKKSTTCSKCYHLRQLKNPKTKEGKYSHKKGRCVDCDKEISDVYRIYCRSCSHKGKIRLNIRGENHPRWSGGGTPEGTKIRRSQEGKIWINKVFIRDDFTCQKYKIRGGKIVAHHILNFSQYPELRHEVSNGITLSEKAHKEFHRKYGYINNTVEQLSDFLNNSKNI